VGQNKIIYIKVDIKSEIGSEDEENNEEEEDESYYNEVETFKLKNEETFNNKKKNNFEVTTLSNENEKFFNIAERLAKNFQVKPSLRIKWENLVYEFNEGFLSI
jgi:hypothetical protein